MKRRGRPPSFSREELVATARELGPDGIGLQQVAAALGVSRTSLYWHVRDQDELGELVLAELVEEAGSEVGTGAWAPPPESGWSAWLDAYARVLRRCLLAGGPWLRYGTGRLFYTRGTLRTADAVLGVLLDDGFDLQQATRAFVFVSEVVYANVRATSEVDLPKEEGRDAFLTELRSLANDDLTVLRRAAREVRNSYEMQFEYDLAAALAGIAARAGVEQP
ncbi:MAG: Tetracyclin repressor protein [Actinomycetia bacterium]|nr:Tetracyclin repressor protein [Actinomycetes bacterium]